MQLEIQMDVPKAGAESWINIYAYNHFWGLGNSLGEDWEFEENADDNVKMKYTSHYSIPNMYYKAEVQILHVLDSCTQRPPDIENRLERRIVSGFCRNRYVKCN